MYKKIVNLPNLTLLVALSLSTIAAYYSIVGLTAIFAGAVVPIIIMGSILEIGKITATVWLRVYWRVSGWLFKLYLVPAVFTIAFLTSMGIFGFLSKSHLDQGVPTNDVQAQVSLLDEKIKTQRENIDLARKALAQMDSQVDARLARGENEQGAERAVTIRRQQAGERAKLQREISDAQKEIAKLNEEKAPVASKLRKVEAEVGPIKYIAALIYGDNPDQNVLERAVRWVIILIVCVFDPLALVLVLAANQSRHWQRQLEEENQAKENNVTEPIAQPTPEPVADKPEPVVEEKEPLISEAPTETKQVDDFDVSKYVYLQKAFATFRNLKPRVYQETPVETKVIEFDTKPEPTPELEPVNPEQEKNIIDIPAETLETVTADDNAVIVVPPKPYKELDEDYVEYDGKHMRSDVLRNMKPELFMLTAEHNQPVKTSFGTKLPEVGNKGDIFVHVGVLPNRVYKYDSTRWIEISKDQSDTYLSNDKYIQFLIDKLASGEYDIETMTETERSQVQEYLKTHKSTDK